MSTVEIKSTNPELIERSVQEYAQWLYRSFPEVSVVYWFGSWVTGIPTPGSDVDLCIILKATDLAARDRIPRYLPDGFPVGLDIFPYTEDEFRRLAKQRPGWYRTVSGGRMIKPDFVEDQKKK